MEYFDIVVVVPLEEELLQFLDVFPSRDNRSTESILTHVVDSGHTDVSMVVVQQQGMGKTHAINASNMMLSQYEAGLIVCLGIAGSLSDDMRLGDVCYTGSVVDVLDNAKVVDQASAASDTELSPTHYQTPLNFTAAFNFIRTQPDLRASYLTWQETREEVAKALVPLSVPAPGGGEDRLGKPSTKNGVIVCGSVSKSELYNQKLRAIDRALLAVETEAGGVFSQAQFHRDTPAIAIRGISDYADKDKKKLEQISKGGVRELAASNAASFLRLQVDNQFVRTALSKSRNGRQVCLPLQQTAVTTSGIGDILNKLGLEVDEALRKLSPEYKLQPKGYRLPLPRIRRARKEDGTDSTADETPSEVRSALERHDRVLIGLPRTYPDQSLAWVISNDLLTSEISGKQAVPVVIDGEAIRGKQSTFDAIASVDLAAVSGMDGTQLVLVIENLPFSSKHRLDTIFKEMAKYPLAKIIFVAKGDADLISASDFSQRSAVTSFEACSISFLEIAHFIEKNFEMTGSEAEVVALRLRDTFHRFDLDAHPTYFAGIPKQTLAALLQANRRSELIQLAVDGFLTFLVAGDRADVALSRSTRARFLRKLVVELYVEKRRFTQAELVAYTKEFADRYDFDIDPLAFINAFVGQGIMHFESDRAHISLPFIESYLLASELSSNSGLAARYFDVDDVLFDMTTFDLYAEIGASPEIISRISDALTVSSKVLADKNTGEHILLGEEISPASIRRPDRADILRKRLRSATEAVQKGTDDTNEKQQMLDLNDRIREETGRQAKAHGRDEDDTDNEIFKPLSNATRHWVIATVLLGSGAEHLEADTKRGLSASIVGGAALVIDEWTRLQRQIDFDELKQNLTSDEALADLPGPDDIEEKRRFVAGIIDILENATMADPLRRVIGFLCEQARHRVLAPSVEKANPVGLVERVIHGTWLADIDATRGKAVLRGAIKDLPRATFFRIALASHYLSRVYWNHWHRDNRLILLEAAEEAIEPLEVSINKPELKRLIHKQSKKDEKVKKDAA